MGFVFRINAEQVERARANHLPAQAEPVFVVDGNGQGGFVNLLRGQIFVVEDQAFVEQGGVVGFLRDRLLRTPKGGFHHHKRVRGPRRVLRVQIAGLNHVDLERTCDASTHDNDM